MDENVQSYDLESEDNSFVRNVCDLEISTTNGPSQQTSSCGIPGCIISSPWHKALSYHKFNLSDALKLDVLLSIDNDGKAETLPAPVTSFDDGKKAATGNGIEINATVESYKIYCVPSQYSECGNDTTNLHKTGSYSMICKALDDVQRSNTPADITLQISGQEHIYKAHRDILKVSGPFFCEHFQAALSSGNCKYPTFILPAHVKSKGLEPVLNSMYSGMLTLTTQNVEDVYPVANLFQLQNLIGRCRNYCQMHSITRFPEMHLKVELPNDGGLVQIATSGNVNGRKKGSTKKTGACRSESERTMMSGKVIKNNKNKSLKCNVAKLTGQPNAVGILETTLKSVGGKSKRAEKVHGFHLQVPVDQCTLSSLLPNSEISGTISVPTDIGLKLMTFGCIGQKFLRSVSETSDGQHDVSFMPVELVPTGNITFNVMRAKTLENEEEAVKALLENEMMANYTNPALKQLVILQR